MVRPLVIGGGPARETQGYVIPEQLSRLITPFVSAGNVRRNAMRILVQGRPVPPRFAREVDEYAWVKLREGPEGHLAHLIAVGRRHTLCRQVVRVRVFQTCRLTSSA